MHLVDLTLHYSPDNGAVKTYLSAKAKWLSAFGRLQHSIVVPRTKDANYGEGVLGVPSLPVPFMRNLRMPGSARLAASVLNRLRPDCIEVGDPFQFAWAALMMKKHSNVPVVAFCHTDLPSLARLRIGRPAGKAMMRYLASVYRRFDLVLAPTEELAQTLRENGINRVRCQPLGVDTTIFNPIWRDHKLRTRLALPPNARLLVHVARYTSKHSLAVLTQTVEKLGAPYHLLVIGNASLASSRQVSGIGLPQSSHALATLLASCDAMLCTEQFHELHSPAREAMACGLPVIGAKSGGLAELVDGMTGVLVERGNAEGMAQGIQHAYRRGVAELGRNARRKMVQEFDWNQILPQLMAQYVSLIASSGRKPSASPVESLYVNH